MDWNTVITGVISALGGGLLGTWLTFKLNKRKQQTDEFQLLLSERKEITQQLTARLDSLEAEIKILREKESKQAIEINNLRNQLMIFESSHTDIPLPMWMKDTNGVMLFLNDYYEETFLIPRGYTASDYIGKNDYAVWSKEIADEYIKNDKKVVRTKKSYQTIETIEDSNGNKYFADILKYPRKHNHKVIGISGVILRTADTKEALQ